MQSFLMYRLCGKLNEISDLIKNSIINYNWRRNNIKACHCFQKDNDRHLTLIDLIH